MATGRKNELSLEVYGTDGALRFDLERLDELWFLDATRPVTEQGFTRIVVTEPGTLSRGLVAAGARAGLGERLHQPGPRPAAGRHRPGPGRLLPDFEDGLALQRILEAIIDSDAAGGSTVRL